MPRPCVTVVLQATEHCLFAKSSLTRRGNAPNKLLNLLEQLLHKIKANRRREMGLYMMRCNHQIVQKSEKDNEKSIKYHKKLKFNRNNGMRGWGATKKVGCYGKIHILVNFLAITPRFEALPTMNRGLHFRYVIVFLKVKRLGSILPLNLSDFSVFAGMG